MNPQELAYLLENSASVTSEKTAELETVLKKYPFFQAARAIHLKGLYTKESVAYNSNLKRTAAYTVDRSVLFDFITSKNFNQDRIALQIKKQEDFLNNITVFEPQEVFGNKSIAIDEAIKMKKDESDKVMDPYLFERASKSQEVEEVNEETLEVEAPAELGTPLNFENSEAHSFSEWLRLTTAKPIERESEENVKSRDRKFELIDDFIAKSPKIKPSKASNSSNVALDRTVPPEALMTETLARVYLEQKNYKKAIQAYKILILKNPEKSGFFADQIRAIKKLQENNTGQG